MTMKPRCYLSVTTERIVDRPRFSDVMLQKVNIRTKINSNPCIKVNITCCFILIILDK